MGYSWAVWLLRIGCGLQNRTWPFSTDCAFRRCDRHPGGRQHGCSSVKSTSKWASLGERVAKLKDGQSIVIGPEGDPAVQAGKVRSRLNGRNLPVRRSVKVVDGKIIITHVGVWPMLSAF